MYTSWMLAGPQDACRVGAHAHAPSAVLCENLERESRAVVLAAPRFDGQRSVNDGHVDVLKQVAIEPALGRFDATEILLSCRGPPTSRPPVPAKWPSLVSARVQLRARRPGGGGRGGAPHDRAPVSMSGSAPSMLVYGW